MNRTLVEKHATAIYRIVSETSLEGIRKIVVGRKILEMAREAGMNLSHADGFFDTAEEQIIDTFAAELYILRHSTRQTFGMDVHAQAICGEVWEKQPWKASFVAYLELLNDHGRLIVERDGDPDDESRAADQKRRDEILATFRRLLDQFEEDKPKTPH